MLIRRGTGSPLACLGGTIMSPDTEFDPSEGLISPDYEKNWICSCPKGLSMPSFPKRGLEAISRSAEEN